MDKVKANQRLESWVDEHLSKGRYGFSLDALREKFSEQTETAIKFALKRLSDKGKIVSIYKGYYLMIPPQYASRGMLPPAVFMDAFMKNLNRPYYVALLNAAAFHGASHQQSQEFFVMTYFPVLRPTSRKGIKVNYISIKEIPKSLIEQRKTEAGYLNISNPVLTATDIIQFEKRVGGLNRAATVLNELSDGIRTEDFNVEIIEHVPVTALQRLGYLLENVCNNKSLADALFNVMQNHHKALFRIPLKVSGKVRGFSSENRWKVVLNTEIEIDE